MNAVELSGKLAAIASPHRMRIIAMLQGEPLHVSELARRMEMSRALLYMHLSKLEDAGFVTGHLELSDDGKALKLFEVLPFVLNIDPAMIVNAISQQESE
ncbi:MAG: winged helix-turn-helix transcriptional regulator [Microbacteriaceae bacterium]|nr:winged helix-turn-helix transcriptional regulator [Microbacteriaceae bacterium]